MPLLLLLFRNGNFGLRYAADGLLNFVRFWCILFHPDVYSMGIGGSTASRSSPVKVIPKTNTTQISSPERVPEAFQTTHVNPPTSTKPSDRNSGCCSHHKANHAHNGNSCSPSVSERTSYVSSKSRKNSIDEEIEEIVANTLDLTSGNLNISVVQRTNEIARRKPTDKNLFPSESASETLERLRKSSTRPRSGRAFQRIRSQELLDEKVPKDLKSNEEFKKANLLEDVDFEKFKRVNHKGSAQHKNGKVIHHQDSDLLWRLGLISPETYSTKSGTRSAPVSQDDFLKPPSYDLTEEQLMANIEKEYTEYAGTVN